MAQMVDTFWTPDRILLLALFILGLIIGGFVTNKYVDPFLGGREAIDKNSFVELNARLDARNDQLYKCLVDSNATASACNIAKNSPAKDINRA